MTGKMTALARNMDGSWMLTLALYDDPRMLWDKLRDKQISVEIKQFRNRRSLDANNFCWALCSDIGKAMSPPVPKEEVYRKAIREVGVYVPMPIKEEAVEAWQRKWSEGGTGWFCDVIDNSKLQGYKLIHAYFGSSTYDSKEMSILIDNLVDDAEQMGIPIPLGKKEIEVLKHNWRWKHE